VACFKASLTSLLSLLLRGHVVPFTIAGAGVAVQSSMRTTGGCTGYIVCALGGGEYSWADFYISLLRFLFAMKSHGTVAIYT